MTRRALPKPVEAWAVWTGDRWAVSAAWYGRLSPMAVHFTKTDAESDSERSTAQGYVIRVRIVPITPKKRTKRKEKR